jgi:hypothetical protein
MREHTKEAQVEGTEWDDLRVRERSVRAALKRRDSGRRRLVDPTTCERNYTPAEIEFMNAMHQYKLRSGRMFPTWSEVLEVLTGLGYTRTISA